MFRILELEPRYHFANCDGLQCLLLLRGEVTEGRILIEIVCSRECSVKGGGENEKANIDNGEEPEAALQEEYGKGTRHDNYETGFEVYRMWTCNGNGFFGSKGEATVVNSTDVTTTLFVALLCD